MATFFILVLVFGNIPYRTIFFWYFDMTVIINLAYQTFCTIHGIFSMVQYCTKSTPMCYCIASYSTKSTYHTMKTFAIVSEYVTNFFP